ncbi:P-loop containing nucleoside triphosphate hydrolase protein [Zychaea mexicana]|uniref:P-loop containing nucleoside triphosphate hydrolase protein n=1 Tax=Zychaea mexicana TaxID=64656 RepID=UPI0022FE0F69|nr:P-loop containing nucleoside triphosphate hydrolase protein [Zychaea mexicana]KAI9497326.1 P-loop containing nucleoside triphosphate hydrolase protein [Zychaea mexicana]
MISFSSSQHLILQPIGTLCIVAGGYKLVTTYPTAILKTCYCEAAPFQQEPISLRVPSAAKQIAEHHRQQQRQQCQDVSLIRDIWNLIRPDLLLMGCIILTAVAAAFIQLQTPLITGELINIISSGSSALLASAGISQLNRPALKLFGLLSAQGILTFAHISLVSIFGENVAKRLRAQLFSAMVRQDMSFFDSHRSGELVGRLTTDVADFKHTFKQLVTQGLKSVTQTVGSAIHLFRISTPLTLTMLGTMPVLYVLLNVYGAYLRKLSRHSKDIDGKASGVAGEVISNMRTVRAFAAEDKEMNHYSEACDRLASTSRKLGFHVGMFQGLTNVSIGCMVLTVLYYGGSLVVRNELTGGELMSYMLSTQTAQQSLVSLGVLFGQTIKAAASATRVFEFIHMEPAVPIKGGDTLLNVWGDVRFQDIGFAYPSRPEHQVLEKFNLHVPQGTTVALCGSSGSGKSTIASLLERFYEPIAGTVFLDGHDLSEMDPSWLRQQIGFINQEPVLFATSILENIRYGRPDASMEQVQQAARQANAETFIESFPDGYDTVVGERGAALSGGQKQRIAIARAILKDPKILILDEATSALDTHSEKVVQDALDKVMKGRTVLVIAHRLSTIRAADMIVVMGRVPGNIVEMGTHDELMAKRGVYFKLNNQLETAEQL